ncbi:MAG TPA: PaaI family thioesterase [Nevskiaceae bacterium]|nr:PaaI family thioesterase [Nevskiaceae bacterium]
MSDFIIPDPQFEARVRASFANQAMMRTLGAKLSRVVAGGIEIEMPHGRGFTQQDGFLHAGAVAAPMDSACGYAAMTLTPVGARVLTIEFKINLLSPANAERYLFEAHVTKAGRTIAVCDGAAYGLTGTKRKRLATMTATVMTMLSRT